MPFGFATEKLEYSASNEECLNFDKTFVKKPK